MNIDSHLMEDISEQELYEIDGGIWPLIGRLILIELIGDYILNLEGC